MYRRLILFTILFGLVVILLGAYTRLGDAGLGCPDWPGCYGNLLVPESEEVIEEKAYLEQRPLEVGKAWKEMVHRYFAGTLGLLILLIAVISLKKRGEPGQPVILPVFLVFTLIFQALLGMWTVTLQLKPLIVMGHLIIGFATLSLLFLLFLRTGPEVASQVDKGNHYRWGFIALLVLVFQIALGGWTSSNYAALACPDFPTCQGSWVPEMDFMEGFVLWRGLGINYEFGVLEHPARTAIHFTHRIGALITFLLLLVTGLKVILSKVEGVSGTAWLLLALLFVQVSLGIGNVVLHLPLGVAVAHNGVAALLLLVLVKLNYQLWLRRP